MDIWNVALGASLVYSLYNAWPEMVAAPARRAAQSSRYADAMRAFGRSAGFVPPFNRNGRARMMLQAAIAALDAGLPLQAIAWAERVRRIEHAYPVFTILADGTSARAFAESGDPWNAERHLNHAIEAITPVAERLSAARAILATLTAQVADEARKRGDLRLAAENATRAIELGPAARREASVVLGECSLVQGRYEEALRWFSSARGGPTFTMPWAERRAQGLFSLHIAATLASSERPGEVGQHLDHAYQMLRNDPRMRIWCDCTTLQVRAFGGDPETVRAWIAPLESAVESFPEDRVTRLRVWSNIARASLRVGDHATALRFFAREEAEGLDPVWEARNAYGVGLCSLALGDIVSARRAFRRATSRGLDTYHDRLARQALAALDTAEATTALAVEPATTVGDAEPA